jgi:ribosomal protein S12 methylthiotransferase accessory factor
MNGPKIEVTFPGGVRVDAAFKGFTVRTDQPVKEGGEGTAPSPFDFFLFSLATCAGYFIVAFCAERKIPTEGLSLAMTWDRSAETHLITIFRIAVTLPPGFPDKYKAAVLKAADQCTVKRHMLNPPAFEITAV